MTSSILAWRYRPYIFYKTYFAKYNFKKVKIENLVSIKNYIAKCGANDDENFLQNENFLLNELVAKLKG